MFTNTADLGGYIKNELTVHWTANVKGDAPKRTKVACGQKSRTSYAMVHGTEHTVNCVKCLALQAA